MNLRTIAAATAIALSAVALTGCAIYAGPPTTEDREVASDVHAVVLESGGDIVVTLGDTPSLTVTAPAGAIDRLTSTSANGVLTLGRVPGPWFIRGDVSYDLTVTSLDSIHVKGSGDADVDFTGADSVRIRISGSGDIDAEGIDAGDVDVVIEGSGDITLAGMEADDLAVRISGSGDIEADGRVGRQEVRIEGSGNYQAGSLVSRDAVMRIEGAGDMRVNVTGTLDATIAGSGSILYRGEPDVTSHIMGSGNVSEF